MQFDSNRVSLSLRDSYFTVNKNEDGNYFLSSLEDRTSNKALFALEDTKDFTVSVSEECISLKNGAKSLDITFYEGFYAVLKGNFPLRLLYDDRCGYKAHTAVSEGGEIRICDVKTNSFIWLKGVNGSLKLNSSWIENRINSADVSVEAETENGGFEIIVYKTKSIGTADICCPSFEECCDIKGSDFKIWCGKMNAQSEIEKETAFVLWQNIVAPLGLYKQEAILCNKTHMNAVWGWDNCFHALGVAKAFPKLAFYQLMLIFENADESGALPDSVTPYKVEFGFTKPPVHSFIYEMLMERNPFFCEKEQIEKIYKPLCKNFKWWTSARLNAPVYWHGNESGADNATCFDKFSSVKSPDLYAMLSYTAKMLSKFAEILDKKAESEYYLKKYYELGKNVETMFFDGESFFVLPTDDFKPFYSKSLLPLQCVVVSELLSNECKEKTFKLLKNEFIGDFGITSEAFTSEKHVDGQWNSYWRGSVWGCQQVIFAQAAKKAGYLDIAKKIANGYKKSLEIGGSAENSNSLNGSGNCAKAFSWSAAAMFSLDKF